MNDILGKLLVQAFGGLSQSIDTIKSMLVYNSFMITIVLIIAIILLVLSIITLVKAGSKSGSKIETSFVTNNTKSSRIKESNYYAKSKHNRRKVLLTKK